jgi:hypothetical protein
MPPLAQLVEGAVAALIAKIGGQHPAAPAPPVQHPAPTQNAAPTAADPPKPGLAYTVFRVDSARNVTVAGTDDTYKTGEGIAISVTNNTPGILDVVNIDGAGKRTALESLALPSVEQIILPSMVKGFYALDANNVGDEKIELRFFPCKDPAPHEGMGAAADVKVAQAVQTLAAGTAVRPQVSRALASCPSAAERLAASNAHVESMSAQADEQVAVVVAKLANVNSAGTVNPVVVTVNVKRSG